MIISHEHKFIFLKTKKTAGTAIEAALSELCGPRDVITPYREESEADRKGLPPQNYRIDHPLKPKRPLLRRLLMRPERYYHQSVGYLRAHARLPRARLCRRGGVAELFQIRLRPQPVGPAGLLVSLQDEIETARARASSASWEAAAAPT